MAAINISLAHRRVPCGLRLSLERYRALVLLLHTLLEMTDHQMRKICIIDGIGTGATAMSAFDAALWSAGIGDLNLIVLSSVIPPDVLISVEIPILSRATVGSKLYCVLSRISIPPGQNIAAAGLAWCNDPKTGGFFLEEQGDSECEVELLLSRGCAEMRFRRNLVPQAEKRIVSIRGVPGKHTCAIVCAVYDIVGWNDDAFVFN